MLVVVLIIESKALYCFLDQTYILLDLPVHYVNPLHHFSMLVFACVQSLVLLIFFAKKYQVCALADRCCKLVPIAVFVRKKKKQNKKKTKKEKKNQRKQ